MPFTPLYVRPAQSSKEQGTLQFLTAALLLNYMPTFCLSKYRKGCLTFQYARSRCHAATLDSTQLASSRSPHTCLVFRYWRCFWSRGNALATELIYSEHRKVLDPFQNESGFGAENCTKKENKDQKGPERTRKDQNSPIWSRKQKKSKRPTLTYLIVVHARL